MDPIGDIKLNKTTYRVELASYREKDLADFSPRASVAGGSVSQSELMLYQPLYLTDWRHGIGFIWNTDAMGYMTSMGNIDTRQPGIAMLFTEPYAISTDDLQDIQGFTKFNNKIYTWGPAGLRCYDPTPGTWTTTYPVATNYALATANYLFWCPNGERIRYLKANGDTGVAGIDNAIDLKWMVIHKGYVYAGSDGTAWMHEASQEDLSDMEGGAPADTSPNGDAAAIAVGYGSFGTLGAISFGNELYVFRRDGVWIFGTDKIARRILDYTGESSDLNFRGSAIFNGYLYYSVRSKIYQWNGSRVVDVTPPRLSDSFPYSEIRTIGPMVTINNFLYVIANWYNVPTTQGLPGIGLSGYTYTSLFCFDGVGWHKLMDFFSAGGRAQNSSMFFDGDLNRLYYFVDNETQANSLVGTLQIGETSVPPQPFPTNKTNVLVSSRLDMGFRRVDKFSPSLLIEASNISYLSETDPNRRYLSVYAHMLGKGSREADLDTYTTYKLGDVTQNGVNELFFPGIPNIRTRDKRIVNVLHDLVRSDTSLGTEPWSVYKYIVIAVYFNTVTPTQSPILEGMTLRFLLRPDVFYGYNMNIVAATNMVVGDNIDTRTAGDIVTELKTLRNNKHPIQFVDIYGLTHQVYISSITNVGVEMHEESDLGSMNNVETMVNINLVETR